MATQRLQYRYCTTLHENSLASSVGFQHRLYNILGVPHMIRQTDPSPDQEALFRFVFESPTDDHLRRLTPTEYEQFMFYLFARDGLYRPVLVDGPGDGGVDLELHEREGIDSTLVGVAQCKRYLLDPVRPQEIARLITAALAAKATRRYFFTTSSYTPAARREARNQGVRSSPNSSVNWDLW